MSVLVVLASLLIVSSRQSPPDSERGAAAEALIDKIEKHVGKSSWQKLAAVSFYFVPGGRSNFKDFRRGLVEVAYAYESNQYVVQFDEKGNHLVFKNRNKITDWEADAAHQRAVKFHINDYFWLNPFVQLRSPGVASGVTEDGQLLIRYESGGATPGDSYLIKVDESGQPNHWKLWVSVLAMKGLKFTIEDWREVAPGAKVSLMHKSFFKNVELRDVKAMNTYPDAENKDRFGELVENIK